VACGYLLTILIPCHSLQYLSRSIESITRQTLPIEEFEVLLVADRVELVEVNNILGKSGLNFRVIESTNPGIVPALNLGLANITSEFVARMDEDDLMMPRRLELQYQHLLRNKETSVVGGQLLLIDVDDEVIGVSGYRRRISKASFPVFESSPIAHPAAMFRRKAVEQIGGYRDFLPEDWDLWVRLSEYGPIENLTETVLHYRVHPNQLSREKMYAQQLGRQFVSVSHFARMSGIRDAPNGGEDKSIWLEETRMKLRLISMEFRQFEKRSERSNRVVEAFQSEVRLQRFQKVVSTLLKYPIATSAYLIVKIGKKIKLSVNKAK
jgi:glycosyltransferase involved in cell wall biosynthesis